MFGYENSSNEGLLGLVKRSLGAVASLTKHEETLCYANILLKHYWQHWQQKSSLFQSELRRQSCCATQCMLKESMRLRNGA